MKRYILSILLPMLVLLPIYADSTFYLRELSIRQGEQGVIGVTVTSAEKVTAFQTDILLPEGIELGEVAFCEGRAADHVLSTSVLADGTVRIGCWSPSNATFMAGSDDLFTIGISIPETTPSSIYEVTLSNSLITFPGGRTFSLDSCMTRVYVGDGDVPAVDYSRPVDPRDLSFAQAYKIRHVSSGRMLSLNPANGVVSIEDVDDGNPNQTFYLEPDAWNGRDVCYLRNVSGRYVNATPNTLAWFTYYTISGEKCRTEGHFYGFQDQGELKFGLSVNGLSFVHLTTSGVAAGSSLSCDEETKDKWQFFPIDVDNMSYLASLLDEALPFVGLTKCMSDCSLRRAVHEAQLVVDYGDAMNVDGAIDNLVDCMYEAVDSYNAHDTSVAETVWGDAEYLREGEYTVAYEDADGTPHFLTIEDGAVKLTDTFSTFRLTDGNTIGGDHSTLPYAENASYMECNGFFLSNPAVEHPSDDCMYTISTQAVQGECGSQHRTWESQVFFYNPMTDKYAIRLTNSVGTSWGPDFYTYVDPSTLQVAAAARPLGEALRSWTILRKDRATYRYLQTEGTCGTGVSWRYDVFSATLYIYGTGLMTDFPSSAAVPWNKFLDMIETVVVIGDVGQIGDHAFDGCTKLSTIAYLTTSVPALGDGSFSNTAGSLSFLVPSVADYKDYGNGLLDLNSCSFSPVLEVPNTYVYSGANQKLAAYAGRWGITIPDAKLEKNAGSYSLPIKVTVACGDASVTITVPYDYTIKPAEAIARVRNASRNYGAKNPAFSMAYDGLKANETSSVVKTKAVATCEATETSPVGQYDIICDGAVAANYVFAYEPGTLTVRAAKLRAKVNNVSRYYGEPNPPFSFSWTGFVNGEDESVVVSMPVATTDVDETTDAGVYSVKAEGGEATNYTVTCSSGQITIVPVPQSIVWNQDVTMAEIGVSLDLTATASSGLDVSYSVDNEAVATVNGATLTFKAAGVVRVTASQEGDRNHAAAQPVVKVFSVGATDVNVLSADEDGHAVYDLQGRRVPVIRQGVIVRRGRKTLER